MTRLATLCAIHGLIDPLCKKKLDDINRRIETEGAETVLASLREAK